MSMPTPQESRSLNWLVALVTLTRQGMAAIYRHLLPHDIKTAAGT